MLSIQDLHVAVEDKAILRGLNLEVRPERSTPLWGRTAQAKVRFRPPWPGVKIMR
ncbi:iron-sulfur cluster assembly ATPase protein SufC [Klebsiella pneumoniae]|uniref:Iron-sulfur cluster assembly ATPase protein SufC n=1 Tax=Klebsiella pneumoniae TaxID=573 RepID=A0A378AZV6_KLEPN|nr:iron-sulfur cluster assembly ATPase protein SufC [Klebsiella pneumoniae]